MEKEQIKFSDTNGLSFSSLDSVEVSRATFGVSKKVNYVKDIFEVLLDTPIKEHDTEFAQAYAVRSPNPGRDVNLYALVFRSKAPIRISDIIKLRKNQIGGLNCPEEIGIIQHSHDGIEYICAIMPKISGTSLSSILNQGKNLNSSSIINNILKPVVDVLEKLHDLGIMHGSINADSIFVNNHGNVIVKDCISESCGFSQKAFYETPYGAQSIKYGKSNLDFSADYYALGITLFVMLAGREVQQKNIDTIIKKLEDGTYEYLNNTFTLSGSLGDLIRGMVIDNKDQRWNVKKIKDVISDNHFVLDHFSNNNTLMPHKILFNDREFRSMSALAYCMYLNWDKAQEFIKSDKIIKWLNLSNTKSNVVQSLLMLNKKMGTSFGASRLFTKDEIHLFYTLIILDPEAPIRLNGFAFFESSLSSLLLHTEYNRELSEIKLLVLNIMKSNLLPMLPKEDLHTTFTFNKKTLLDKMHDNVQRLDIGFGPEKCIYDAHRDFPYQGAILSHQLLFSLEDALKQIEESNIGIEPLLTDKNFAAFILSKIPEKEELTIKQFEDSERILNDDYVKIMIILGYAQSKFNGLFMNNLCMHFLEYLKAIISVQIRSAKIRDKFINQLKEVSKQGVLSKMTNIFLFGGFFQKDKKGTEESLKTLNKISANHFQCQENYQNPSLGMENGFEFLLTAGYISCAISLIFSILKYIS